MKPLTLGGSVEVIAEDEVDKMDVAEEKSATILNAGTGEDGVEGDAVVVGVRDV